jgi:hypothetical protein
LYLLFVHLLLKNLLYAFLFIMYPGLFLTSSYMSQIYCAIIPNDRSISPLKKIINRTMEVQPEIISPQNSLLQNQIYKYKRIIVNPLF